MKILRKTITLILVVLAIFTLINSTKVKTFTDSNLRDRNGKTVNTAVIFFRTDDPYTMRIAESLENIEKDNKNNIKFTFFNPQNNIAIQNEMIDSAVQGNYDLLILYLAKKEKNIVEDVILKAQEKNIPLILMNIPSEVVAQVSKLYSKAVFVTPDSKQAGIAQGKIIVDLWNNKKKIIDKNGDNILQYIMLEGPSDDSQVIDRTKYSISTINNAGIRREQLALVNGNWSRELAKNSIDNLFLKLDGSIEAIIANNDAMALGAIDALRKYGYNSGDKFKNIVVVGIDGLPEAKDLIDKGFMTGTVIQDQDVAANLLYTVGMNLANNLNPIENTSYKIIGDEIIIPYPYNTYTGKTNNS
ncbi:galactose ABC transporter substrate-binding protein [Clostridium sp. BL-8]|uniref:galactose ABC transporter substrate-binding protein n=1 Tax=Clostridium sp. BL-8 TaxID=349938 RepID=UPI00098C32F1|nr:galactose ABC transporter substrate-binding protein [Clostridium sp. BL-8]OOM77846.1 D-galactose-binding periplasmic protein precursor [Clostridium sp. BL-8]